MSNEEPSMKETEQQPDRDENGKFLPGNQYLSLNAFKDGNIGRPNKWTVTELKEKMAVYLQACLDNERPITNAGLRLVLGISAEAMDNYSKGEYGKTDEDKQAYADMFGMFFTVIEDELETELRRKTGQVSGIIFALKNQFSGNWKDEKYINLDTKEARTIKVILHPDSALAKRLKEAGCEIEVIDHEPDKAALLPHTQLAEE